MSAATLRATVRSVSRRRPGSVENNGEPVQPSWHAGGARAGWRPSRGGQLSAWRVYDRLDTAPASSRWWCTAPHLANLHHDVSYLVTTTDSDLEPLQQVR